MAVRGIFKGGQEALKKGMNFNRGTPINMTPGTMGTLPSRMLPQANEKMLGSIGSTGKMLWNSARTEFAKEGAVKNVLKGTVKAGALDAGISGGLAALQGEDVWDAAKGGFMQGAKYGAGYMGLKTTVGATSKFGRGGLKETATGIRDTFRSTRASGQEMIRREGVSNSLFNVLRNNQQVNNAKQIFKHQ